MKNKEELKKELYNEVSNWVDKTFNNIHIDVIKHTLEATEEFLEDLIEPLEIDCNEFLSDYDKYDQFKEWWKENKYTQSEVDNEDSILKDFCEQDEDFEDYKNNREAENYPIWNICFETKNSSWKSLTEAAKKVGCGIINESEYFNDTIFMTSAGHSFYAAYWIPMYLEIFDPERKKYKGIDYSNL